MIDFMKLIIFPWSALPVHYSRRRERAPFSHFLMRATRAHAPPIRSGLVSAIAAGVKATTSCTAFSAERIAIMSLRLSPSMSAGWAPENHSFWLPFLTCQWFASNGFIRAGTTETSLIIHATITSPLLIFYFSSSPKFPRSLYFIELSMPPAFTGPHFDVLPDSDMKIARFCALLCHIPVTPARPQRSGGASQQRAVGLLAAAPCFYWAPAARARPFHASQAAAAHHALRRPTCHSWISSPRHRRHSRFIGAAHAPAPPRILFITPAPAKASSALSRLPNWYCCGSDYFFKIYVIPPAIYFYYFTIFDTFIFIFSSQIRLSLFSPK